MINELKSLGKPFLVLVNSQQPDGAQAEAVCREISEKYGIKAQSVNCLTLDAQDIDEILKSVLYEFPVREIGLRLPEWAGGLEASHPVKSELFSKLRDAASGVMCMRQIESVPAMLSDSGAVRSVRVEDMDLGSGSAVINVEMPRQIYYDVIREESGVEISGEGQIIELLRELSQAKREYDRIFPAIEQARSAGYGIVMPSQEELSLEQPEIVRQGGRFGVRLRASAPSLHLIRADIRTEVSPVVGSERQSEDLVQYLLNEFDDDAAKIWDSNIFGKSLHDLITEGLNAKLLHMPQEARVKLQETLERIINEGSSGLICIIL